MNIDLRPAFFARRAAWLLPCAAMLLVFASAPLPAQDSSSSADSAVPALPDSPGAGQAVPLTPGPAAPVQVETHAQQGIFNVFPPFRSLPVGTVAPRQSVKDKFVFGAQDSFSLVDFAIAGAAAAISYGSNNYPEFGTGGIGYSRYLWHTFADETSEKMLVESIIPAITHEDTRFYFLGHGSVLKRAGNGFAHTFVTRTDSGHATPNLGEFIGTAASAGLSNLYYPRQERTAGNFLQNWGINFGFDAVTFVYSEFYPNIYHAIFRQRIVPVVQPGS